MRKRQETKTPDLDMQELYDEFPIREGSSGGQDSLDKAAEEVLDLQKLQEELLNTQRQRDEYLNLAQRVQADFDNYRRRNNAARAEAFDEGAVAFIKILLPIVDDMERAVASAKETSDTALRDGVNMILNQLMDILEKRGVLPIARLGERFDPILENAVLQGSPEEGEPGTICEVFQKGYIMDKTVIRHAMVKVVVE